MPSYYVYSPFSGYTSSCPVNDSYCVGSPLACDWNNPNNHPKAYCSVPVDVIANGGAQSWLFFWGSSNILSVKFTHRTICSGSQGALSVELFSGLNGVGKVGEVYYGHLQDLIAEQTVNTSLVNGKRCVTYIARTQPPPGLPCSNVHHAHMECCYGAVTEVRCPDSLVEAQTWIYRWDV